MKDKVLQEKFLLKNHAVYMGLIHWKKNVLLKQ